MSKEIENKKDVCKETGKQILEGLLDDNCIIAIAGNVQEELPPKKKTKHERKRE